MNIIDREDIMRSIGRKGVFARWYVGLFMRIFGITTANKVYNDIANCKGGYPSAILNYLHITYNYDPEDLKNIPPSGPLIIISNHPTGGAEGVFLLDMISKVRPDVKIMANTLLQRIEPLRNYTIAINPFDNRAEGCNHGGLREAIEYVSSGGALIMFPAGSVATWQHGFGDLKDMEWERPALKFIRRTGAPVMPVFVEAHNSLLFHLLGKIHPLLRTVMLPAEMFKQAKRPINVIVGTPCAARRLEELGSQDNYAGYLRASVDYLKGSRAKCSVKGNENDNHCSRCDNIIDRPDVELLKSEMAAVAESCKLFTNSSFSVYCAQPNDIPNMMKEIGREREITFRSIGEGTLREIDTDRYDEYYHQLFIWDDCAERLVGAYRLGFGQEIVRNYGVGGFYTHSLFRQSEKMESILLRTIELGRSFIVDDYQRNVVSLMMLWKGIIYVLLKNKHYRYLLGPVTISGEFKAVSKKLIVTYLSQHYFDADLSQMIRPVNGLKGIDARIDESLIEGVEQMDLIGRIVSDIEQGNRTVPVLIKKYLQLNSHVLGFNVDHDFCDSLDALMLLDLYLLPEKTIAMLSKEITDIDVVARFREIEN